MSFDKENNYSEDENKVHNEYENLLDENSLNSKKEKEINHESVMTNMSEISNVEFPTKKPKRKVPFIGGFLIGAVVASSFFGGYYVSNHQLGNPNNSSSISYAKSSESGDIKPKNDISSIVKEKGDAVVSITTTSVEKSSVYNFNDPSFQEFWGELPQNEPESTSLGSGFIISDDGYILTNQHVVNNASSIKVKINGIDKELDAKLIGQDEQLDLAVIKVNVDKKLPTLKLGESNKLQVGEWAIAIGNPYGLDHTVTLGVISAVNRSLTVENSSFTNLIQTDTPINPGNSGGPLLNDNGDVIGINTAINAEGQNIGFAIPIDTVKKVLSELIEKGSIARPYIGVEIQELNETMADYYHLKATSGAIVTQIVENSPAQNAGLQLGDIITKVDDKTITTPDELVNNVQTHKIGDKVHLTVNRDGKNIDVLVVLENKQ